MTKGLSFLPRLLAPVAALLLTLGMQAPARAASTAGPSRAVVVAPLSLVNTRALDFGSLASGATGGMVNLNPDTGARTLTGGVTPMGGTFSTASFTGAASGFNLVIIRRPTGTVTLTHASGPATMSVTNLTLQAVGANLGGSRLLFFNARQAFSFAVGGTLNVGPSQADGFYSGSFNVTIDYY